MLVPSLLFPVLDDTMSWPALQHGFPSNCERFYLKSFSIKNLYQYAGDLAEWHIEKDKME